MKDGEYIHPRDIYAERMSKLVPHIENRAVQYALACAAKHFGLFSSTSYVGDISNWLFGHTTTKEDAENSISNVSVHRRRLVRRTVERLVRLL